jgi:hypothetical protein
MLAMWGGSDNMDGAGFEVPTAVSIKSSIFWGITPYSQVEIWINISLKFVKVGMYVRGAGRVQPLHRDHY